MSAQGWRPNQMYEITTPSGVKHKPPEGRCWSMIESEFEKLKQSGRIYFGKSGNSQPNVIRYLSEVEGFVPWTWWPHEEVGHTDEARKEIQDIFGTQTAFDTPKPTRLLKRVFEIASNPGDLILDSFAGSGTTGNAILTLNHELPTKKQRHFLLIEMDGDISRKVTAERIKRVSMGYAKRNGDSVTGLGGGFRFCELGEPLFDESGKIRESVSFNDLAKHVYFSETGEPLPGGGLLKTPLLGVCRGTAIFLLYNGILGDKSARGGNVLTRAVLAQLPPFSGQKVIYCSGCLLGRDRLQKEGIIIRQTPYEVKSA